MHAVVFSPSCDAAGAGPLDAVVAAGSASTCGCHTNGIAMASSATAVTATAIIRALDEPDAPLLEPATMDSVGPCVSSMSVLCPMSAIDVTGCNSAKCAISAQIYRGRGPTRPRQRTK